MQVDSRIPVNLNNIQPERSDGPIQDNSTRLSTLPGSHIYFRDLERHLVSHIKAADFVAGCVAWLTSKPILNALSRVPQGVSIVVQKEDFLRPDVESRGGWTATLRKLYDALKEPPTRLEIEGLDYLSFMSDPSIQPVRCVGIHNSDKGRLVPRMHNKFLVFCHVNKVPVGTVRACIVNDGECEIYDDPDDMINVITPYAAWTGSYNMSKNATMSLENAVFLQDPSIAGAYYAEWRNILSISEPLDWSTPWSQPEWHYGS